MYVTKVQIIALLALIAVTVLFYAGIIVAVKIVIKKTRDKK
jgi:hypothetical protein